MWNWSTPEVASKETLSFWARSKAGASQMFWGTRWGTTVLGPHGQGSELNRGLQTLEHRQPGDLSKVVVQLLLSAV